MTIQDVERLQMVHPQTRELLRRLAESGLPPTHTLQATVARKYYRDRGALTQAEPAKVASVRDLPARGRSGEIPLRIYSPLGASDRPLGALIFYHGGGWVIGDLDTHDVLCRDLANGSGCAVVAVDYRLAPEHPFPAAVEDAVDAATWITDNAQDLNIDPSRLAVGGDSAGANLAAVVALHARDRGGVKLQFQLLIYPGTDQRGGMPSHAANGTGFLLTRESIDYFHAHYIHDPAQDLDWRASPLLAEDHGNLPPAFIVTAGFDPIRDEGLAYAQKLSEAGTKAALVNFERQIHGFITMGKIIDEANTAVQLCASQLRLALAT